jgi:hypothetical protein
MTTRQDPVENLLRQYMQPVEVPPSSLIWGKVRPRLSSTRRSAPILQVAFAVLLLVVLSASLAAASPDVRAWLGHVAVSMGDSGGRVDSLYPAPPFGVLQPATVPRGWTRLANGYNPGPAANGSPAWSATGSVAAPVEVASRSNGQDLSRAVSEQAQARAQDLLASGSEATFVLVYADADGHQVEIRERAAAGKSLPAGETTRVGERQAVLTPQGLVFSVERTYVEISGSASPEARLLFAGSLEPTPLAPFETSSAAQAILASPTPPAWTRLPVSARLGPRISAAATPAHITQQCGWDPSLSSRAPGEGMLQVHCAARLASGIVDEQGGSGTSQVNWQQAAQQLGIDPATGPAADAHVWLVQLNVSEQGGSVVVLDAQTAQPYLVARLKPAPE